MTNRTKLYSLLAALLIGCASTTSPNNGPVAGSMTATVNGQSWSSAVIPGVTTGTIAVRAKSSNTLTISGTSLDLSGTTHTIALVLINPHLGMDSLGFGNTGTYSNGTPGQDSYVTAGFNSGQVNLTQYDTINNLVTGTFNFTAHQANNLANTVTVTNGVFTSVKWTDQ